MGLLDDLKKQAEQVKTQQLSKEQLQQHGVKDIDDKAKQLFQYVGELLKQLVQLLLTELKPSASM